MIKKTSKFFEKNAENCENEKHVENFIMRCTIIARRIKNNMSMNISYSLVIFHVTIFINKQKLTTTFNKCFLPFFHKVITKGELYFS